MQVTVKVAELAGRELDYWVGRVIGVFVESWLSIQAISQRTNKLPYAQRWEAVGYLMAKFNIGLTPPSAAQPLWTAYESISGTVQHSDDPKLAVLRCLVASRLEEVFTDDNPDRRVSIETLRSQNSDPLPVRPRAQTTGNTIAPPRGNLPAIPGNLPDSWI